MFNIFKRKKKPASIKVNAYRLNVQSDITAYELYQINLGRMFHSYQARDEWYDKLPELCKRHLTKVEEYVDYNELYV